VHHAAAARAAPPPRARWGAAVGTRRVTPSHRRRASAVRTGRVGAWAKRLVAAQRRARRPGAGSHGARRVAWRSRGRGVLQIALGCRGIKGDAYPGR